MTNNKAGDFLKAIQKNKLISHSIRVCVGVVFVASAVLKYTSIEAFDLYVYEHNLFNLAVSSTLTRLLIAAEFSLGIFLITNLFIRFSYIITYLFLFAFTIYLLLQPYLFDVQLNNCFCFGDKIVLNHLQSIGKNIILMILMLGINCRFYKKRKNEFLIFILIVLLIFTGFMVINAPDYLYTKIYQSEVRIDTSNYQNALQNSESHDFYAEGRKLICLYSHHCTYCKRASQKIEKIRIKNEIPFEQIVCVFWDVADSSDVANFFEITKVDIPRYTFFNVDDFFKITNGQMPIILYSNQGEIIKSLNYAGLVESEMVNFLKNK